MLLRCKRAGIERLAKDQERHCQRPCDGKEDQRHRRFDELAQKVGQMTQAEIKFVTPEEVKQYYLGSVLTGGGGWPKMNKYATAADWLAFVECLLRCVDVDRYETKVPVVRGIDAIHGNSNVVGATLFPTISDLGAAHNP